MQARCKFLAFGLTLLAATGVFAQANPLAGNSGSKPLTLLVPTSSGTGADISSRLLAPKLSQRLGGRPVVVENRTGASGQIGYMAAIKATPDGSTILVSPSSLTVLPHLVKAMTWDPFTDLVPVALLAGNVLAPMVGANVPVKDMAEFVALARSRPGQINYATPGVGTPHHLIAEMFKQATGVNIVHIPYKTSAAAVTDIAGGQVQIGFFPLHSALPLVKAGKLRVLATISEARTPWTPEVPTMREAGIDNVAYNSWTAVFLPRGASRDLVNSLARDFLAILAEPGMRDTLQKDGLLLNPAGPDELGAMIRKDSATWGRIIKAAGIAPE